MSPFVRAPRCPLALPAGPGTFSHRLLVILLALSEAVSEAASGEEPRLKPSRSQARRGYSQPPPGRRDLTGPGTVTWGLSSFFNQNIEA